MKKNEAFRHTLQDILKAKFLRSRFSSLWFAVRFASRLRSSSSLPRQQHVGDSAKKNNTRILAGLFVLFAASAFLSLVSGAAQCSWKELWSIEYRHLLWMRLLRLSTALISGAGLSVGGAALQALLRNPLAEPYLLGTSSGAGLGAIIGMILGVSAAYLPVTAFLGALCALVLVYVLAQEQASLSTYSLILSGVIVGIGFSGIMVFLTTVSAAQTLPGITWWLLGSLQAYDPLLVIIVGCVVVFATVFFFVHSHALNALCLGEEEAAHIGIDHEKVKRAIFVVTALLTGALVSLVGVIGFVGLIIPHAMRCVVGPHHRILIPACFLAGGTFLILGDILSRVLFPPVEIPIGVITSIIGAPAFMILFKRSQKL